MVVKICLGSSCHMKGAYKIVEKLKETPEVKLYGSLCMNNCSNGVNVEIDGILYSNVTENNIEEIVSQIAKSDKDGQ